MKKSLISELSWDSNFFGRKIGEFHADLRSMHMLNKTLLQARDIGYRYLLCKLDSSNTPLIKALESNGFYLTDISVTWHIEMINFLKGQSADHISTEGVRPATEQDIPMARNIAKGLFLHGRFYNDPFFTEEEADTLYQTWIENSIRDSVNQVVFLIPNTGFISCRKLSSSTGEIILIGVREKMRKQEHGKYLFFAAMGWFKSEEISEVRVKTQLRNIGAMNFYSRLGFAIKEYSLVFGNIL